MIARDIWLSSCHTDLCQYFTGGRNSNGSARKANSHSSVIRVVKVKRLIGHSNSLIHTIVLTAVPLK